LLVVLGLGLLSLDDTVDAAAVGVFALLGDLGDRLKVAASASGAGAFGWALNEYGEQLRDGV
jgi:hypothetical protein